MVYSDKKKITIEEKAVYVQVAFSVQKGHIEYTVVPNEA